MPASSVAEGKSLEANTQPKRQPSGSRCASLGQRVCRCRETRVGVRLIPKGHSANRSLSAIEPVSAPAKRKLENGEQRPVPEIYPARAGDRRWHSAGRYHGHRPRQSPALFLGRARADDLAKHLSSFVLDAVTAASGKGRDGGADRRGKNGKPGWSCSRAFPALILQHALK